MKIMANEANSIVSQAEYDELEKNVLAALDRDKAELIAVSRDLHANPETAYKEYRSSALLAAKLEEHGFKVQHPAADLDTAFIATCGEAASPTIAILAEYDA